MSLTRSNHSKARTCWSKAEAPIKQMVLVIKTHLQHTLPRLVAEGSEHMPPTAALIFRYIVCRGWTWISHTHEQLGYFAFNNRIFSFLYYLVKKGSRYTIKTVRLSLKIPYYPLMFNLYWDLRTPLYWDK